MVPEAQFGCPGLKFLAKTVKVCPLLSQVSCHCCYLCERKAFSTVQSFHPISASAGDMPFFTVPFVVIQYEKQNACSISSVVVPFPFALSRECLNVSAKHSA